MKLNPWLLSLLALLGASALLAQDAAPEAKTNAPAHHPSAKAKSEKKKVGAVQKDVVLDPPLAATVKQDSLNVRGQPSFTGEVLAHLHQGETVTVLEEITLAAPKQHEPANWARITMPSNTPVWVSAEFIDSTNKVISSRRVNVRGGPGENFSIVARLEKGTPVKELRKEKGWVQIETPANAYAFVAADYLEIQAPVAPAPIAPAPAPAPVADAPKPDVVNVPPPTTPAPAPEPAPVIVPEPPAPTVAPAPPGPPEIVTDENAPRIVTREGFVNKARNIQAPADFELRDILTSEVIEYLEPKSKKEFKAYVGSRCTITGQEVLDKRWPRTPIIKVQTIDLMP